mmetsp:Transcript_78754/g.222660  ORF Transcript_78754/g.222660 Transcript_78754/m.222660 type:complete len:174 (-) Transcript_78754:102-623(-)
MSGAPATELKPAAARARTTGTGGDEDGVCISTTQGALPRHAWPVPRSRRRTGSPGGAAAELALTGAYKSSREQLASRVVSLSVVEAPLDRPPVHLIFADRGGCIPRGSLAVERCASKPRSLGGRIPRHPCVSGDAGIAAMLAAALARERAAAVLRQGGRLSATARVALRSATG